MIRRLPMALALCVGLLGATLVPALGATAAAPRFVKVTSSVPASLSSSMPLLRLHFSAPASASKLPALRATPALDTTWQQISPFEVQAVATGPLRAAVVYHLSLPTRMRCTSRCTFLAMRPLDATATTNYTWETQLLAELHYLPLRFTPSTPQSDPTQAVAGTFAWAYPGLPTTLSNQWQLGVDNVILHGALMDFQSITNLATTGVADTTTWSDLVKAVSAGTVDPNSYNYVDVSETLPEHLTLYVAGKPTFQTPVNTGISVAPTALGTYPVYVRYLVTTMSGKNPDGTVYHDPGIQWVSYFNGGDALHEFPRYSYGWPQSLGCVEMPMASAKTVFPYTPIGTLVTVQA